MPWVSCRVSMLPPNVPGGMIGLLSRAGRADAHRAEERLDRDGDVVAQIGDVAVARSKTRRYGVREVVREQAEAGMIAA